MKSSLLNRRVNGYLAAVMLAMGLIAGCGEPEEVRFRLNMENRDRAEIAPERQQFMVDALTAMFGTPDDPKDVFPETNLDVKKLKLAAGSAAADPTGARHGLYRKHCVHCHGITGDGAGPTAGFLNPYPRDYRNGVFKFTSTQSSARPTTADLKRTVIEGIPGTAMPSFSLLANDEIDALVEYVRYLAIRGETETLVYDYVVTQEEDLPLTREFLVEETLAPVVANWDGAEGAVISPESRPPIETPQQLAASVAIGRKLFQDQKTKCADCHGPTGMGDGPQVNFDLWNKEKEKKSEADIARLFALPIQQNKPRNLRLGIYRGGRRPIDIFRRMYAGIKGTPMPSQGPNAGTAGALTEEQIWHLVDYVRTLPYEESSNPFPKQTVVHKERN